MKKIAQISLLSFFLAGVTSCNDNKTTDPGRGDTTHDTITTQVMSDTTKMRFQKLIAAMPVPFDMLDRFSGAKVPFKADLPNKPDNVTSYNGANLQSLNLGIYGADLAYMISQDKLSESGPYLKSIRRLSDAVIVPTAFDAEMMKRYEDNSNEKDSLQSLINTSYKRIDSTLQGNDRLVLASLVITGGWLEGLYLTTQHIGDEPQNEKNKVLYDMLAKQQPYVTNITELLGAFPNDSTCMRLHKEFIGLKKNFPSGDLSPEKFAARLKDLRTNVAEIRNSIVSVQ